MKHETRRGRDSAILRRPRRIDLLREIVVLLVIFFSPAVFSDAVVRKPLESGVVAAVHNARLVFLECTLPRGDAARPFIGRLLVDPGEWTTYRNRMTVAIPLEKLNWATRRVIFLALFPYDYVDESGWWHITGIEGETRIEEWDAVARWFTGTAENEPRIRQAAPNRPLKGSLQRHQRVLIPKDLLAAPMRKPAARTAPTPAPSPAPTPVPAPQPPTPKAATPADADRPVPAEAPAPAPAETPVPPPSDVESQAAQENREGEGETAEPPVILPEDLVFQTDAQGPVAEYRIKPGEALYTAVVVRFTDIRDHRDILEACRVIQQRSGIRDVRDIAAGQRIRIPLDMLSDRFQPQGSERREAYEATVAEADRLRQQHVKSEDLSGIVVVLDPGHGGRDYGAAATASNLYEDEIAYDIACRLKGLLEARTQAKVHMTMRDRSQGFSSTNEKSFKHETDEEVLTTPPYPNEDAKVSANLRWYLANSLFRQAQAAGVDERKVVFLSIHCDMLFNERVRGAMVYIPGAAYRRESEKPEGAVYNRYQESRDHREATTTAEIRRRDEAISLNLSKLIIGSLRGHNPPIKVHSASEPIRNVIRQSGGRAYVPAVLRNTLIPTKVLVEVANMNNATDRERLADPEWRQWFAEALYDALKKHFDSA